MITHRFAFIFVTIMINLLLTSCGGEADGSGSSANKTPQASATPVPAVLAEDLNEPDDNTQPENHESSAFYFSYDDSASTASKELTFTALQEGRVPPASWGRPYEYLNSEKFTHFNADSYLPFDVSFGIYAAQALEIPLREEIDDALYALGVNISGPNMTQEERPNVVLTLLVDVSGSMEAPYAIETYGDHRTLLDVVKVGLMTLLDHLKEGDVLNLVTFSTGSDIPVQNWFYNPSDDTFTNAVAGLYTQASTNLNAGITKAYEAALQSYQSHKANRVIILTDAYVNQGEVNPTIIAENTVINGREGIHFAGIGIGNGFNDRFLNQLTDIGKSVYAAMISPGDAERIFGAGFMNFIDSAVSDVKFRLIYPNNFTHFSSAAEEVSEDPEQVNSTNFSYNSSQFFLELFSTQNASDSDTFVLTITYKEAGETQTIEIEKTLAQLQAAGGELHIKSAAAATTLASLVNGELSCDVVLASSLYAATEVSEIFSNYRDAIDHYCALINKN